MQRYNISECGGILTGSMGSFATPNFPSHYSNSLDCEWVIRYISYFKPSAYVSNYNYQFNFRLNNSTNQIDMTFATFDIESHNTCRYMSIIKYHIYN